MKTYLRLIQSTAPERHSPEEREILHGCIVAFPGVEAIHEIAPHPRGGYSVTLEVTPDSIEPLIRTLAEKGYRAAF